MTGRADSDSLPGMAGLAACLWGLLGSAVAEALNLSASVRPTAERPWWRWPWTTTADRGIVMFAVGLRLFVGCGLAAALGASGQLPTPFTAFLAGLAAPLLIARIFASVPVGPAGIPPMSAGQVDAATAAGQANQGLPAISVPTTALPQADLRTIAGNDNGAAEAPAVRTEKDQEAGVRDATS
jgi:hypothetical protein